MESERGVTGFRSTQDNLEKVNRTYKEEYIHLVYMKEMEERQHVDFIERSIQNSCVTDKCTNSIVSKLLSVNAFFPSVICQCRV
jgi:hypothetical protein